ncbi:MAG TPA: MaoC/PaaZ C-terminal domain-containing protein [Candidatus Dormibacteraeota bacterium]|jgi:acyl dehydratase|nr:MaoC/PaaZ C-terminal domain-containing protein [Candidatus Dormibacteraeota bacterium]
MVESGRPTENGPGSGYTRSFESRRASLELQHFEDLPLGSEWTTRRRTIGPAEVAAFLGLAGDLNPLYADAEYARSGPFGEVVVPGALIVAVAIGLGTVDGPLPATVGLVGMDWRFQRPVRVGDTIRCRWRLHRKREVENPRWGLAVWQVEVANQRDEVVATAELVRLVSRRQVPAEGRPGKRRRRRRGLEGGATELPPKPPPGPLSEPGRWPRAAADEHPRPAEAPRPERGPAKVHEVPPPRPPEPAASSSPDRPEAADAVSGPGTPAPGGPRRPGRRPGRSRAARGPERPSPTPEPGDSRPDLETVSGGPTSEPAPGGAWRPPEEVLRREETPSPAGTGAEIDAAEDAARPVFAPLAPEAAWPPALPAVEPAVEEGPQGGPPAAPGPPEGTPEDTAHGASEAGPVPRPRRRAPAPEGDAAEVPAARRRRRRHAGGSTPATSDETGPAERSSPEEASSGRAGTADEGPRDHPVAPVTASPEG